MSQPQPLGQPPTEDQALADAARLLRQAEMHTDRELMKLYIEMADGWTTIAAVLTGRAELEN
ncbi:hypothetical protein [Nocardiopsis dassonvillei]|uniref:hypothetical protein n=1 Tax=Nocardiopsis dassonvillei TaxID=2014 RepID=UPI003640B76B